MSYLIVYLQNFKEIEYYTCYLYIIIIHLLFNEFKDCKIWSRSASVFQISVLCSIADDLVVKSLLVSNYTLAVYRLFKSLVSDAVYISMHLHPAVLLLLLLI